MQKRLVASGVCLFLAICLVAGMCVLIWRNTSGDDNNPGNLPAPAFKRANLSSSMALELRQDQIELSFRDFDDSSDNNNKHTLQVYLARGQNNTEVDVVNTWPNELYLTFKWSDGSNMTVQNMMSVQGRMSCYSVEWKMPKESQGTPKDCFDMKQASWFGGFEESYQFWPINIGNITSAPFVTGDGFKPNNFGDVIEGLFVSSAGVGIYVYDNSSLYLSVNENSSKLLCLNGKIGPETPYFNTHVEPVLRYDICHASDIASLYKGMANRYLPKPNGMPSEEVMRNPIWSTWALYKGFINQSKVLDFAKEIKANNFGISQLELDDNWTPAYGDYTFDTNKFPDAKSMVSDLKKIGIPLTVWMHPFFNNDSKTFAEADRLGLLIKASPNSNESALTSWWRGTHAGVIDVTNPVAVDWYLNITKKLRADFNVASFKFDAGEVNFLPEIYGVKNPMTNPSYFSQLFVQMAYNADTSQRRQEVRTGYQSQEFPVLVRMIDRLSSWGHDKGLKTLIPTALTMGLMGYPFVLPDMVGGNAYDPSDLDKTVLPDPELYLRWLQVTALMPSVQFSIPPWKYNSTIVRVSKKFTELHESFGNKLVALAMTATTKGKPIIRPLWWLAPNDEEALQTESQFLLGDDVLVAPVLEKGAVSRDIYLPNGKWRDDSTGTYDKFHKGPIWLKNFPAGLDILPYFTKISEITS